MDRRTQDALMGRLRSDADRICGRFGLRYRSIDPERANVKRRYGICYDDGSIKIRLRHAATGDPLKYSSLVNTLCHELAHLKHFNHGPHFKAFYLRLLEWARREGIYRPGPKRAPQPPVVRPVPPFDQPIADRVGVHERGERGSTRAPGATADGRGVTPPTGPVQLDLFAAG